MKRHSTGFYFGIVGSIIVGFVVLVAVWVGLGSAQGLGFDPPALQATKTGSNSAVKVGMRPTTRIEEILAFVC